MKNRNETHIGECTKYNRRQLLIICKVLFSFHQSSPSSSPPDGSELAYMSSSP